MLLWTGSITVTAEIFHSHFQWKCKTASSMDFTGQGKLLRERTVLEASMAAKAGGSGRK